MNAAILIAGRELRDKARLFITALALAPLPFLATLLPAVRVKGDPTLVALLGGMAAFSMAVGVAAILGASTIGRELSDGRLSFYFSRPIPPAAIWIGKATAALLSSAACFAIIAVPVMLYARDAWSETWTVGENSVVLMSLLGSVILFFLLHAMSTMVRSRSGWLALDFVLAVGAAVAVTQILRPLAWAGAKELVGTLKTTMAVAALLVFAIAPIRQLAVGRTDRRRSHAALSKVLWSGLAVVLLLAGLFVAWVVSATPKDLRGDINVGQAPATGWMIVSGHPRMRGDYHSSFLIDPKGESRRMGPMWWGTEFSRDGKTLAWGQPLSGSRPVEIELYTLDLTKADAKPVATGITYKFGEFVLSDDGRRVAVQQGKNLSVHDLGSKQMLFSGLVFGNLEGRTAANFFFVSNGVVRVLQQVRTSPPKPRGYVVILEVDLTRRTQTKVGETEELEQAFPVASMDGSRIAFRREGLVVDGRTGATVARYGKTGGTPLFLSDGALALASVRGEKTHVTIHRPNAAPVVVPMPAMGYAHIRGEIAPHKLAVEAGRTWEPDHRAAQTHIFIINTLTGAIERVDKNVRGPYPAWNLVDPRPLPIDSGRPMPAYDENGRMVMWNPMTGARTAA